MVKWTTPVYDRTKEDVALAKAYNTDPSIADGITEYKGALNASDLNRIEGNCEYLARLLYSCGYTADITVKTDWTTSDFPTLTHFNRIRSNITELMDVYAQAEDMPDMRSDDRTDYIDVNNMEFDLLRVNEFILSMDQLTVPTDVYKTAGVGYLKREIFDAILISSDDTILLSSEGIILCAD